MAVAGYQVRIKKTADGAWGSWVDVSNVLTHQFTGLDADTEYQAQVRAYDAVSNYSAASSTASATTEDVLATDSDALAFLNAASITDLTIAGAVDDLVIALKAAGVWTPLKAIYPFVGGTAATHKLNLKDPQDTDAAFRLTFTGGWTHSATGALPNGSTGYADTHFVTNAELGSNDETIGCYLRTDTSTTACDIGGTYNASGHGTMIFANNGGYWTRHQCSEADVATNSDKRGWYCLSRTGSGEYRKQRNGTVSTKSAAAVGTPTVSHYLAARNVSGSGASHWSDREQAFAVIGAGLTQTQMEDLYTAVQAFQTALSRNV